MKLFSSLIGIVVLLVALVFAVSNRQPATISLWPLDVQVQAPLCLLTLGTFFCGLLVGALIVWASVLPHRFAAQRLRKDIAGLREKIDDLQHSASPHQTIDAPLLPRPRTAWPFRRAE